MTVSSCYIVGKGYSLDQAAPSMFEDSSAPVICLNESILAIERMKLSNTVYSMQQDGQPANMVRPESATLMLSEMSKSFFPDYPRRIEYDRAAMGLGRLTPSCVVALRLAAGWGARTVWLVAFDACTSGDTRYAPSLKAGNLTGQQARDHREHCRMMARAAAELKLTVRHCTPPGKEKP